MTQSLEPGDDQPQPVCELLFQRDGEIVGDRDRRGIAGRIKLMKGRG
jgi:hypothetical protein